MTKVAYLFGAGASHAEIKYLNRACRGILMDDFVGDIPSQLDDDKPDFKQIINILALDNQRKKIDIEQIITLYEHDVAKKHHKVSHELRRLFRKEITTRINQVVCPEKNGANCSFHTSLLSVLFDMHKLDELDETICAVLTTNYDDLIERALQNVYGGFDYRFEIVNKSATPRFTINSAMPLLKLHGSFNWVGEYPIELKEPSTTQEDHNLDDPIIWAPPGTNKNKSDYPFSSLWNTAREILKCDVLRIIGCSLNRNDWQLITLIHDAQKMRNVSNLKIELLDYPKQAYHLYISLPFLNIDYIPFEDYFSSYCADLLSIDSLCHRTWVDYSDLERDKLFQTIQPTSVSNIFQEWLTAKGLYLRNTKKIPLNTEKNLFKQYLENEDSR
ncbi:MAG: SIR2 family protein [Dehalogenimonas sp.]